MRIAMESADILQAPVLTEKASGTSEALNQVALRVHPKANKDQIRDAVQSHYGVVVSKVRTMLVAGKLKRRGRSVGRRPTWKKAIVTLAEGHNIDFYAAE